MHKSEFTQTLQTVENVAKENNAAVIVCALGVRIIADVIDTSSDTGVHVTQHNKDAKLHRFIPYAFVDGIECGWNERYAPSGLPMQKFPSDVEPA